MAEISSINERYCKECGIDISNLHKNKIFCSSKCNILFKREKILIQSKIKFPNGSDYLECKICGLRMEQVTVSHLKTHGISNLNEYKEKFNLSDKDLFTEEYLKFLSDKIKGNKNPGYQHNGRLSPFSKKFKKYQNNEVNYTIKDIKNKIKETRKHNPQNVNVKIEYWINKGYSEIEAKEKLSERQTTFSLKKCIEKYGEETGYKRWTNRQKLWQDVLNSKSEDEIKEINFKRGKSSGWGIAKFHKHLKWYNEFGILYYIRFFNEEIEFWKIGITKLNIHKRFGDALKYGLKYEIIFEEKINYFYAYLKEQCILKNFDKYRVQVDYSGFKSTECFNRNVFNV